MKKLKIALYGSNGHQIQNSIKDHPNAEITVLGGFEADIPEHLAYAKVVDNLDQLLEEDVDLVSLCSSLRSEQAEHAVKCMEAGKHVYAEKPSETQLGNDVPGSDCRRAVSFIAEFENGGLGTGVANYCFPQDVKWPAWGYEINHHDDKSFLYHR